MWSRIKTETYRALISPIAVVCIIVTFLILLQANWSDFYNQHFQPEGTNLNYFCIALIFSYLPLVAPVISAMPYSYSFCDEARTGFATYSMIRGHRYEYLVAKIVSTGLSGGIVLGVGVFLYGLFVTLLAVPYNPNNPAHYISYSNSIWEPFMNESSGLPYIIAMSVEYFIFGFIWSNVGMAASSFIRNRYIALTAPFIIYYILLYITPQLGLEILNPSEMLDQRYYLQTSILALLGYQLTQLVTCIFVFLKGSKRGIIL